ncbi:MAG: CRTAC1 family protein [Bacteroidota bacterium]
MIKNLFLCYLLLALVACSNADKPNLAVPATLEDQPVNFSYRVNGTPLKQLHLEVESASGYSNLTLAEGANVLLDNLDIPDSGSFSFDLLVDFGSLGSKDLEFRKIGGDLIIQKMTFSDVEDFPMPVFKDISEASGLLTEPSWKYGGPTVADIDNNGYYDVILNNHDKIPTQLFLQQKKGKLTEQQLFPSRADFHGTAAGDYDNDGDLDIVNSIGGGNGTNPKPPFFLKNERDSFPIRTKEVGIIQGARGRSVRWIDVDLDGDLDLFAANAAGINSTDSVQHIFYENKNGKFENRRSAGIENADAERVLVTDLNNDQKADLVMYSPLSIWLGNGDFTFTDVSSDWLPTENQELDFISAITDIDLDNDGYLDLYIARGKTHYQMANKSLDFNPKTGRIDIRDEGNKAITKMKFEAESDIVLSDIFLWYRLYDGGFPIFVGENKDTFNLAEQEKLVVTPEMAAGWPSSRTENGWYLGYLGEDQWEMEWIRNKPIYWGVRISIDGVKSVTPVDWNPQNRNVQDVLLKNENEKLVDVSSEWNLPKGGNHWGVTRGDFNNDSFEDLFVYRFGGLKSRYADWLLMNTGQGRFEMTTSHAAKDIEDEGHGDMGQAFDFELDGQVDLLSGSDDPGKWYLYNNNLTNNNNFVLVRVGYSPESNIDPYSAVVIVETPTTTYRKRVGSAGEIHSQSLLNNVHFGLGKTDTIKKITVKWRNGEALVFEYLMVNALYEFPRVNN